MTAPGPAPISSAEQDARNRRIRRIARRFGFVGRIEYRHVTSGSGGAQFGLGSEPKQDLLAVYAEAFVRDVNPDDFSLEAIIAHERGHQIVFRNKQLREFLVGKVAPATEEILASLVASWLVQGERDRQDLVMKSLEEAVKCGLTLPEAMDLIKELRSLLEQVS